MIAVDTNILIYAHRTESNWHREALASLTRLAEGADRWGIPWPCLHEFISITTHPRVFNPPTPLKKAFDALGVWLTSPTCRTIGEGPDYFMRLRKIAEAARIQGPMIHDARIAAICLDNGVNVLWTADRDFSRYRALRTMNPLVSAARKE